MTYKKLNILIFYQLAKQENQKANIKNHLGLTLMSKSFEI
jgi:hypothetical protein